MTRKLKNKKTQINTNLERKAEHLVPGIIELLFKSHVSANRFLAKLHHMLQTFEKCNKFRLIGLDHVLRMNYLQLSKCNVATLHFYQHLLSRIYLVFF